MGWAWGLHIQLRRETANVKSSIALKSSMGEARVSETCGYMQYLSGDGLLRMPLMIQLTKWYTWVYWFINNLCPCHISYFKCEKYHP